MTTDLYSVLPGIQPSSQEILEAELLATQILSAQYPDMDLRAGTGLRDLVIRPQAMLLALVKKGVEFIFTQNSLSSTDDLTPTDVVDGILSNWFLQRQLGTQSVISARLYFARQKNTSLSSSVYFSTDNTLKFYPAQAASYASSSMVFDSFNNEFYIDVDLVAEKEGSDYNIGSGSLLYFTNFDPYFLRAEINFLKTASIPSETNLKFINRAQTAISTRNLINVPSVDANLRAAFNYVTRLVTVGMGDAEMVRDQIKAIFEPGVARGITALTSVGTLATATLTKHGYNSGQKVYIPGAVPTGYNGTYNITVIDLNTFTYVMPAPAGLVTIYPSVVAVNDPIMIHDGGMVDIYCSDQLATAIVQFTLDQYGQTEVTGPTYELFRSSISGGAIADTVAMDQSFTLVNKNIQDKDIDNIICVGTTATVTLTHHSYTDNRYVTIKNATPSAYNGLWLIDTIVNENQFTFKLPATVSTLFTSATSSFVIPGKDFGFSEKQTQILDFGTSNANKTVSMQLNYFQNLDSIQSYLDNPTYRVLCADYLARGLNFYNLHVEITSYNATVPDQALVTSVIQNYLAGLAVGEMFVVSDMMTQLRINGILNIKNPPVVTYKKYTRDLNPPFTGTITDILDPDDRTNVFLLESVVTNSVVINANTLVIT
jgi:hypothetical protein